MFICVSSKVLTHEHGTISCRSNFDSTFGEGCHPRICGNPRVNHTAMLEKGINFLHDMSFKVQLPRTFYPGQFQFLTSLQLRIVFVTYYLINIILVL